MKRIAVLTILALFTCIAVGTSNSAYAQFAGGLGIVKGTVVDDQGKGIANASVTIQSSDGLRPHATHTDATGHFEFTRWDAGQYDLRAYSNGVFSEWAKRTLIRPKKTTEITLHIPSAESAAK
jgi:hypothetical protein